jgi:sarcosine oxidase
MHVVVVGGGIVGLSAAWALIKCGHTVTVIEQAPSIPNPSSASGDEHRIMRHAYGSQDGYAAMIPESFEAWRELWADLQHCYYVPCGTLVVSRHQDDQADAIKEGLERNSQVYERLSARQARRRFPFLREECIRYALFCTEGGVLLSRHIALGLMSWLRRHGATIRTSARALALDPFAGRVHLASGGEIKGDLIVVAAGAWILKLAPELGSTLSVFKNTVVYLEPRPELKQAWLRAPAIVDIGGEIDGYALPPVAGTRLKIVSGALKVRIPFPASGSPTTVAEAEQVRRLFEASLERIADYRILDATTCVYTFAPDCRFFAESRSKALIVSACSGHGYKFGPAIGRRIARFANNGDAETLKRWLSSDIARAAEKA